MSRLAACTRSSTSARSKRFAAGEENGIRLAANGAQKLDRQAVDNSWLKTSGSFCVQYVHSRLHLCVV